MHNSFVLTVSLRYFKAKKNEKFVSVISAFSLIGVMLGVAALIVVMSVMKGFHRDFTQNIIGLNGDISIKSPTDEIRDYAKIIDLLKQEKYVKHVIPVIFGQTLAIGPNSNSGALIRGIDYEYLKFKSAILDNVVSGSFENYSQENVVALGSELASNLGLKAGDKIKLISQNSIPTAFGSMPRSKEYEVIAVFSSNMFDYDAATILMPLSSAAKFMSLGNNINLIEINSDDPSKARSYAMKLQRIIGADLKASSWEQLNVAFIHALEVEQTAMFTILSLIILVAAFNIVSSLFMLVKDKTKDIAILRTIGASKSQIMLIFICNGMFIGFIGSISGAVLGSAFALNINNIKGFLETISSSKIFDPVIYFLYYLPTDVNFKDICIITFFALILCFLATIYPAYKAARLKPVEVLRYE